MNFWNKLFGNSGEPKHSYTKQLEKARHELEAIIQEDGRVANPIGQKMLLGELETLRKNLNLAFEGLQNSSEIASYDVGDGLKHMCDTTLNNPKWALQAAVGTERCRTRVAKLLRDVEKIAIRLRNSTHRGDAESAEFGKGHG